MLGRLPLPLKRKKSNENGLLAVGVMVMLLVLEGWVGRCMPPAFLGALGRAGKWGGEGGGELTGMRFLNESLSTNPKLRGGGVHV